MDPDQPAHPRSLIRINSVRLSTLLQVEKLTTNSMDPDQTARMCRLVWIHTGRKPIMLVLSWHGSFIFTVKSIMVEFKVQWEDNIYEWGRFSNIVYTHWLIYVPFYAPTEWEHIALHLSVRMYVCPHYRIGIGGHLTVNRTKENNRVHSVTIE
jgi:hypothetical protein